MTQNCKLMDLKCSFGVRGTKLDTLINWWTSGAFYSYLFFHIMLSNNLWVHIYGAVCAHRDNSGNQEGKISIKISNMNKRTYK